jgi:predicted PurR-regulated permease PerM
MPDGLVLLGTLGGISMFGAVGLLVGPMIAALFLAVWELYRSEFRPLLVEPLEQESSEGSR